MDYDQVKKVLQENRGSKLVRDNGSFGAKLKDGTILWEPPTNSEGTSTSQNLEGTIYKVCLSKNNQNIPSLFFYHAVLEEPKHFSDNTYKSAEIAYYYLKQSTGYKTTNLNGINSFLSEQKVIKGWAKEDNAPEQILELVEEQFVQDGLAVLGVDVEVYGLIDEAAFIESFSNEGLLSSKLGRRVFTLPQSLKRELIKDKENPRILRRKALAINVLDKQYWKINTINPIEYIHPEVQDLKNTPFAKLGSIADSYLLLSANNIVENISKYSAELTWQIIDKLNFCELSLIIDEAKMRISDDLLYFTYRGNFSRRRFSDLFDLPWLKYITGELEVKNRSKFYKLITGHTDDASLQEMCNQLWSITSDEDEKVPYDDFISILIADTDPDNEKDAFLYSFNFLRRNLLVSLPPEELPTASSTDVPELDLNTINPVFLKASAGPNKELGIYYKHVATVKAVLKEYSLENGINLRIAEFSSDVSKNDLLNYDNDLLISTIQTRTPFHERRLFQLLGLPCREAFCDVAYEKALQRDDLSSNVHDRTYQTRDDRIFEAVKNNLSLKKQISEIKSLEDLEEYICLNGELFCSLLDKMAIIHKVASFERPLSATSFVATIDKFKDEFNSQGHFLAAQICKSVIGLSGEKITVKATSDEVSQWVYEFWRQISDCFPDNNNDWSFTDERAFERPGGEDSQNSVYTVFVLASLFNRQITTFYKPLGRFVLPYDPLVWAVKSIYRLQMLSGLIPMCCGDWVCTHRRDIIQSKRINWDNRLAAVANPKSYSAGGRQVPSPHDEGKSYCVASACRHLPKESVMVNIANALHFDSFTFKRIIQKVGWWFNGLLDERMHAHFRCSCGMIMSPDRKDSYFNRFNCPLHGNEEGHGSGVYLSWCLNSFCDKIIDSRHDSKKCDNNKYICHQCGTCCTKHFKTHKYSNEEKEKRIWIPACRSCSRAMNDAWKEIKKRTINSDGKIFKCTTCGKGNLVYPSEKDFFKRQNEEGSTVAYQWNEIDRDFRYNSREKDANYSSKKYADPDEDIIPF